MDQRFLKLLKESVTGTSKGEKGKTKLHELELEEENVAKVSLRAFLLYLLSALAEIKSLSSTYSDLISGQR